MFWSSCTKYHISPNKSVLPNSILTPEKPLNHEKLLTSSRLKQQYLKNLMTVCSYLINILSKQSQKHKEIHNLTDFLLCKLGTK